MDTEIIDNTQKTQDKTIAIIAYLTIIGLVIAFVMNNEKKDPFATFHIRQALGLTLTGVALSLINIIPVLGWIISIIGLFVILYMWISGLLNALNGKRKTVPILGDKFEEWFKSI